MRMESGITDQYIYFVAVDDATGVRKTGLSSFTVYRSRNGGAAAAYTTPTINETDVTNMPGVYELLMDEDMTIDAGDDSQEICLHITATGMLPVTRTIELYRPIVTAGNTLTVAAGIGESNVKQINGTTAQEASGRLQVDVELWLGSAPNALVSGRVDSSTGAMAANVLTATAINADAFTAAKFAADVGTEFGTAVWATTTRLLTAGTNIVLAKGTGVTGFNDLDAAGVAAATWNAATATYGSAGTYGLLVETNLDAAITSRMATYTQPTGFLAATFPSGTIANTTNITAGTMTTVTTATNVTTVNGLAANVITAAATAADFGTEVGTAVWATTTRLLTAGTNIVLAKGTGITGFNDLDAAGVAGATWNAATASYGTANTYGALIETNIDTTISSRLASDSYTAPDNATIAAIDAKTTNLPSDPADQSLLIAAISAVETKVDTVDTVVDAVKVVTDKIDTALVLDGAVYQYTANALELGPSGSGLDAAGVRAAIGLASANLDTQLSTIDTVVDAILVDTDTTIPATLTTIKDKTDSLTFTVSGQIDANIQYVNDVSVTGNGELGTEWGPA
jgi:predicted Fe-Mo cluster-binding NifX family protein